MLTRRTLRPGGLEVAHRGLGCLTRNLAEIARAFPPCAAAGDRYGPIEIGLLET